MTLTTWDVLYPEERQGQMIVCVVYMQRSTCLHSPSPDFVSLDQQVEKFAITRTTKNELPSMFFFWKRKQIQLKHLGRKRERIEREEKAGKMMEEEVRGKPECEWLVTKKEDSERTGVKSTLVEVKTKQSSLRRECRQKQKVQQETKNTEERNKVEDSHQWKEKHWLTWSGRHP